MSESACRNFLMKILFDGRLGNRIDQIAQRFDYGEANQCLRFFGFV